MAIPLAEDLVDEHRARNRVPKAPAVEKIADHADMQGGADARGKKAQAPRGSKTPSTSSGESNPLNLAYWKDVDYMYSILTDTLQQLQLALAMTDAFMGHASLRKNIIQMFNDVVEQRRSEGIDVEYGEWLFAQ